MKGVILRLVLVLSLLLSLGGVLPPGPRAAEAEALVWATKAPMPTARISLGVVSASNGKIYAIGGHNNTLPTDHILAVVEEYEPATNTWAVKAPMPTARYSLGVATGTNGKIYAIGGLGPANAPVTTVEEYDPVTNTWATKAPMPTARAGLAIVGASNGKIYAIGGGSGVKLATVEEYDPASNTWAAKASMPTARDRLGAAGINGKIYAIGGDHATLGALTTVEEYDPTLNTWTTKTGMLTARADLAVVGASNGKIHAIGGTVEEYNPATNTWSAATSMPTPRARLGAATGNNNKIYAIGGCSACDAPLATVEEATIAPSTGINYSVSVQTAVVCVNVSPTTVNYGSVALNSSAVSGQVTATNCASGPENLLVQGANATATVTGESNWTLGSAPLTSVYVHGFGGTSAGPFTAMTTSASTLAGNVAAAGTHNFFTQIKTPTTTTGNGVRNTTVTVIATAP